jgi:CubicO group peptidase (beta-lactamase class C family)
VPSRTVAPLLLVVLATACATRGPVSSEPPRARRLTADAVLTTRSGATLPVARGWWVTDRGDLLLLEDPERELRAWFLESGEPDGAVAIAAGWRRVAPGAARRLARPLESPPPDGGWDAVTSAEYDGGPERVVEALARRHGAVTHVVLLDGARGAVARRGAQLESAIARLHPRGLREESLAGMRPRRLGKDGAARLDAFIEDARRRLAVPGAAVAVVQEGSVVYERAFGVRALGDSAPVTADTLFMMASVTKPMTTLMQAAEVDAGLFTWDTPVTAVYPAFALADAGLTGRIRMWHMSCACTGMPRSDLEYMFEYRGVTPEARVASMRAMAPTTGLGETFQYSNLMVAAGGYIAAHADAPGRPLGEAYDDAMRRRVFAPIGMRATTFDFAAALAAEHAMPHGIDIDGHVRPVPISMEENVVTIRPAGGAWSNLRDMERFVMTELAGGVAPGGRRVVSVAALEARRTVRIGDPDDGYGLGLGVGRMLGLRVLGHDGGSFGFGTTIFMLPDQRVGIVILTNIRNDVPGENLPLNAVVRRAVLEAIFPRARSLAAPTLAHYARLRAQAGAAGSAQLRRPPDPAWLRSLAGRYQNPRLGVVTITATASGATFDAGEWQRTVGEGRRADGARTLVFLEPPFAGASISVGRDAAGATLTIAAGQETYVVSRVAR